MENPAALQLKKMMNSMSLRVLPLRHGNRRNGEQVQINGTRSDPTLSVKSDRNSFV